MSPIELLARIDQLEARRASIREFNVRVRLAGSVTPDALELLPAELRQTAAEGPLPRDVANHLSGQLSRLKARLSAAEEKR